MEPYKSIYAHTAARLTLGNETRDSQAHGQLTLLLGISIE
jgi:hypothetical protein